MASIDSLRHLLDAGLIRPSDPSAEDDYAFEHALLQEAAYTSLLRTERRDLHRAVGDSLEAAYPERQDELAPRLAEHFLQGGDSIRALSYLRRAGHAAERLYASAESSMHFARAFDLLDPDSTASADLEDVVTGLGRALELQSRFADAVRVYEWLEGAARGRGEPALELTAMMARAKVLATPNPTKDPDLAASTLERALELARHTGNVAAESRVLWNQMILRVYGGGDIHEAVALGQASLELARQEGLDEQRAFTLNDLVYAYTALDDPSSALAAQAEAEALWRRLGNQPMLADCLAISVVNRHMTGAFGPARSAAEEASAIARRIDNLWGRANSRFFIVHVYLDEGRPDLAIEASEETIWWGRLAGHDVAAYISSADLAWIHAYLGDLEGALGELQAVAATPAPFPENLLRPHVLGHLGRVQVRLGDLEAAHRSFAEAEAILPGEGLRLMAPFLLPMGEVELALAEGDSERAGQRIRAYLRYLKEHGARAFVPEALMLSAEVHRRHGREADARGELEQAYEAARAMGLIRILGPLARALALIAKEPAPDWPARAQEALGIVASHIPDETRRQQFLRSSRGD